MFVFGTLAILDTFGADFAIFQPQLVVSCFYERGSYQGYAFSLWVGNTISIILCIAGFLICGPESNRKAGIRSIPVAPNKGPNMFKDTSKRMPGKIQERQTQSATCPSLPCSKACSITPSIYRVLSIPTLTGFCPSTVAFAERSAKMRRNTLRRSGQMACFRETRQPLMDRNTNLNILGVPLEGQSL